MKIEDLPTNDAWELYDWSEVFDHKYTEFYLASIPTHLVRADPIGLEDVVAVEGWYAESPEGWGSLNLYALLELNDGRYAWIEAWCDTTGWGCQDAVTVHVGSRRELMYCIITNEQLDIIGIPREEVNDD